MIYLGSLVYLWFFVSDFEDFKTISDIFDSEEFKYNKLKSKKINGKQPKTAFADFY